MSFYFRLFVTGLSAFVPLRDKSMRIVLVNARDFKEDGTPVDEKTPITCIHFPILAVPTQFVTAKGRRPAFGFSNKMLLPNTTHYWAFPLNDDDLEVTPVSKSPVLGPNAVPDCPDGTPQDEFGWITRMYDVQAPDMLPKASTDVLDPKLVLARLRFAAGTCFTVDFAVDPVAAKGKLIKWTYTDAGGGELADYVRRPIAEMSLARIPIDESEPREVIITSVKNERIVLAPADGEEPRAVLVNLPFPDLFNDQEPTVKRGRDHHFLHFYRLATVSKTHAPFPRPDLYCDEFSAGLGGPKCPPTFFEG